MTIFTRPVATLVLSFLSLGAYAKPSITTEQMLQRCQNIPHLVAEAAKRLEGQYEYVNFESELEAWLDESAMAKNLAPEFKALIRRDFTQRQNEFVAGVSDELRADDISDLKRWITVLCHHSVEINGLEKFQKASDYYLRNGDPFPAAEAVFPRVRVVRLTEIGTVLKQLGSGATQAISTGAFYLPVSKYKQPAPLKTVDVKGEFNVVDGAKQFVKIKPTIKFTVRKKLNYSFKTAVFNALYSQPYIIFYRQDGMLSRMEELYLQSLMVHELRHFIDDLSATTPRQEAAQKEYLDRKPRLVAERQSTERALRGSANYESIRESMQSDENVYASKFSAYFAQRYDSLNYYFNPPEVDAFLDQYKFYKFVGFDRENFEDSVIIITRKDAIGYSNLHTTLDGRRFIFPEIPQLVTLHKALLEAAGF